MALSAGARLGPYEIVAPLGAGGMGEVYRARDTRLLRDVAVKVLPADVASDPERLKRFEQEARTASSLNHPHIVSVYDVGRADATVYIAMELVEGKTLRELVSDSALVVRRALSVACQLADGLAKAHAAGIVHRDLKPENVMVSSDGFTKILDFGLAKLTAISAEELSQMPTAIPSQTRPGTVVGTVAYMSPEQASGRPLDFRSDQFSLGSILYETLTGRRAFARATTAETLAAIIREEPEPVGAVNPSVPVPVRWIVDRCLAKDPEERYGSTRDLARDLARDHLSEAGTVEAAAPARKRPLSIGLLAATTLALVVAAFFAGRRVGFLAGERAADRPPPSFRQLTFRHGFVFSARFAPDGQTIVYGGAWEGQPVRLFTTRSDSLESSPLALPGGDVLSISPSGELALSLGRRYRLAHTTTGMLARAPLAGGAPRELAEDVQEADWSPDGRALAVVRRVGEMYRLEYPMGQVLYTTAGWVSHPRVSPSGDLVAFFDHPHFGDDRGRVAVVGRDGRKKILTDGWSSAGGLAWAARGEEIWFTAAKVGSERTLYAVELTGRLRVVLRVPGSLKLHDVFRDGRVLLARDTFRSGVLGLAPGETSERDLSWHDFSVVQDLSADGRTILLSEQGGGGGPMYAVYLRQTDGSAAVRLGEGLGVALSPDRKWVLSLLLTSPPELLLLPSGAGEARRLPRSPIEDYSYDASFSPDGRRIVFGGREPGRALRLYAQELSGGAPRAFTPESVRLRNAVHAVSPDGTAVAVVDADGRAWLFRPEGGEPSPLPGLGAGEAPLRWGDDGHSLFVYRPGASGVEVCRLDVKTGRKGAWRKIAPSDPTGIIPFLKIQITPDGRSYAYTYWRLLSDLYLVDGLR